MTTDFDMTDTKQTLLHCPFCGPGESVVSLWLDEVACRYRVGCGRCGCSTGIHPTDKSEAPAIEAWNRRAQQQAQGVPEGWSQAVMAAKAAAINVFDGSCSHTQDAIEYITNHLLSAAPKQPLTIPAEIDTETRCAGGSKFSPNYVAGWNAYRAALLAQSNAPHVREGDKWHDAVLAECMRVEGCYKKDDPVATVASLINWHVMSERDAAQQVVKQEPAEAVQPVKCQNCGAHNDNGGCLDAAPSQPVAGDDRMAKIKALIEEAMEHSYQGSSQAAEHAATQAYEKIAALKQPAREVSDEEINAVIGSEFAADPATAIRVQNVVRALLAAQKGEAPARSGDLK